MRFFVNIFRAALFLTSILLASFQMCAFAQDFPNKPIRIIVPLPPGVGPEVEMRQIASRLAILIGQPVIVENRPGASGRIATDIVIKSPPDGYTLLLTTPTTLSTEYVNSPPPYDSRRDLSPVSLVSSTTFGLYVSSESNFRTLNQFIETAKNKPDGLTMGVFGVGSTHHLVGEWFNDTMNVKLRFINYQTTPPYNDASSQQIDSVFESVLPVLGLIKSGKLRPLAISGKSRHRQLPDVPTYSEAGYPQFDPIVWSALMAPSKTPTTIVDKLSASISEVVRNPEFVRISQERSREAIGSTPNEFSIFLEQERIRWSSIIKKAGIKAE